MTSEASAAAPAARERIGAIDGFRVLALFGVVFNHLLGTAGVMSRHFGTDTGVALWGAFGNNIDLFFIISGFVLFLPVVRGDGEFGSKWSFWVGRGARLLPAYWLVLFVCLVLIVVAPPFPGYPFPPFDSIAAHFTAMHGPIRLFVPADVVPGFGIVGPVWMISIVVSFYLLLPFIARSYQRHPLIGLALATALTVGWKEVIAHYPGLFETLSDGTQGSPTPQLIAIDQLPGWSFSFALGMTGAWAYHRARHRYPRERLIRFSLILLPLAVLMYLYGSYEFGSTTLIFDGWVGPVSRSHIVPTLLSNVSRALAIGVVILGPLWLQRPFDNRVTRELAKLSYGVYLFHIPLVIYAIWRFDLPRTGTIQCFLMWAAVILPPALLLAYLSRRFVEDPARRWAEGHLLRRRTAVAMAERPALP